MREERYRSVEDAVAHYQRALRTKGVGLGVAVYLLPRNALELKKLKMGERFCIIATADNVKDLEKKIRFPSEEEIRRLFI